MVARVQTCHSPLWSVISPIPTKPILLLPRGHNQHTQAHVLIPLLPLHHRPCSPELHPILLDVLGLLAAVFSSLLSRLNRCHVYLPRGCNLATLSLQARIPIPKREVITVLCEDRLCRLDRTDVRNTLVPTPWRRLPTRTRKYQAQTSGRELSAAAGQAHC